MTTLPLIVDSTADDAANSADPLVDRRMVRLNFAALVNAFNAADGAYPAVGDWAIPAATLTSAYVAGSDTQALGGALAYHYGCDGTLGALDFATAGSVLGDANFASSVQSFSTSAATGQVRLLGAAPLDSVDLDSQAAVARRWIAANEAMAGLDARRPLVLGGEPVKARLTFDDMLGVDAMAMANASRSRQPRNQVAAR